MKIIIKIIKASLNSRVCHGNTRADFDSLINDGNSSLRSSVRERFDFPPSPCGSFATLYSKEISLINEDFSILFSAFHSLNLPPLIYNYAFLKK